MTQESSHSGHGPAHANDLEARILAALWEEVPFPRLPSDAPPELKALVVEIENPRKIYTIHRAIRRHSLQLLIEKFISQLRYGCGYDDCTTPSCFSCRRRLAGKAPIRRYSPTSARTLAVQMAGQDNPELNICPNLDTPRGPSDAIKPLIFGPKPRLPKNELSNGRSTRKSGSSVRATVIDDKQPPRRRSQSNTGATPATLSQPRLSVPERRSCSHGGRREPASKELEDVPSPPPSPASRVLINERPIRKDYRSFAANMFGTVAFKMLEWLAPNNMEAISSKAANTVDCGSKVSTSTNASTVDDSDDGLFVSSASMAEQDVEPLSPRNQEADHTNSHAHANGQSYPTRSRANSSTRVRTSSTSRPLAADRFSEVRLTDGFAEPISPLSPVSKVDKVPKRLVRSTSSISRQRPNGKPIDDALNQDPQGIQVGLENGVRSPGPGDENTDGFFSVGDSRGSLISDDRSESPLEQDIPSDGPEAEDILPQGLSHFNIHTVDLLCHILQQDGTAENHLLEPQRIISPPKGTRENGVWRRRKAQLPYPHNLRLEWKLFIEQSIFNVLSDPHSILETFTTRGELIDSQSIWYYMLRLTRVAPSLVFDSLWTASESLFAPPKALQSARSPTANFFPQRPRSLTNEEAGFVLSVCFHALVAAAPVVFDASQLFDMSRIRSRGLTLSESGAVARQPSSLCLEYEDVFTDDLALRLARRLLAAIPTRKHFDELIELDQDSEDGTTEPDILEVFLSHLEPGREQQQTVESSRTERELHEKRVPILLLDWARTVMLNEWEGRPDVPGDGPFGGALSLIEAMYQKRNSLLLADVAFRTEYFGDRLDAIDLPVSWLAFNSSRQKAHLLDYPYIFHPSSLVSYFRAANFSRMSRSYEESSSLQTRITAIIATDSLVTDQHQKGVLQDLLKVASAKFLILDIGRKSVIKDAFDQLWRRQERELMRPLKVHLGEDTGEEGFDSGGVQQEFFRLAIAEALDPAYGAFTVDDRTRMTWFRPGSLEPEWKFELVGLLMSLAVFNGLTLPVTFPKALYMKLLGEPVTELHHIADGWPDLANGLTTLQEWDESQGAVEDIFARTYEFSIDMFGQPVSREMDSSKHPSWPQFSQHLTEPLSAGNPEDAPLVTGDNREAYVSDYIRYLTDVSVAPQFAAFARGFRACLDAKSLRLLTPALLQSLVEGTQEIDIGELRRAARYVGWDASHRAVRDFWAVVKRYDAPMRRRLLEFVTASDRVPVGGMRNVQFVVQRNGQEDGDAGHLPTAYTCYGTLLLPEYRDREVLRERLAMALENAQGFGFA
ncbi:uncharacterized protein JN550_004068 [Neoarthrinium moseri]|uniref:uncharacterized protein n=1 Tax=Neoarthrinium moseri TaxID=1658444 RepID=UPI001FDE4EB9|nr:uncharacterized protein JN550_004068 [Neoarthrinium moseri]KAI1872349.1 hypothetical protein JN550_004068 [Neoarthrinium moseri]